MMDKKVKVRLIVDVEYDANGVPPRVLRDMLEYIPQMAASNGLMTGDTEAHVATWEARTVEVLDMPEGFKEWLLAAVEDGVIDLNADAVIRYGLKEPAELIQEWHERLAIYAADSVGFEISAEEAKALEPVLREALGQSLPRAQLDRAIEGGAGTMALLLCEQRRGDLLRNILPEDVLKNWEDTYPGYGFWAAKQGGDGS